MLDLILSYSSSTAELTPLRRHNASLASLFLDRLISHLGLSGMKRKAKNCMVDGSAPSPSIYLQQTDEHNTVIQPIITLSCFVLLRHLAIKFNGPHKPEACSSSRARKNIMWDAHTHSANLPLYQYTAASGQLGGCAVAQLYTCHEPLFVLVYLIACMEAACEVDTDIFHQSNWPIVI